MTDVKPNCFIAGFPRCGSTYLCNVLRQHSHIDIPEKKEIHYFNKIIFQAFPNYESPYRILSWRWYTSHFGKNKIVIDPSINAAYDKNSAKEIKDWLGDIKIIFVIRDKESFRKSMAKQISNQYYGKVKDYDVINRKFSELLDYYEDFEGHIKKFREVFSEVLVVNIVNSDETNEIKKIEKFLEIPHENLDLESPRNPNIERQSALPKIPLNHWLRLIGQVKLPVLKRIKTVVQEEGLKPDKINKALKPKDNKTK